MKTEIEDNNNWIDDLLEDDDYRYESKKTYKLDDEKEDLLDWLDSLVEEEKVEYVSFQGVQKRTNGQSYYITYKIIS